jgi:S1-C subfamily serine protease
MDGSEWSSLMKRRGGLIVVLVLVAVFWLGSVAVATEIRARTTANDPQPVAAVVDFPAGIAAGSLQPTPSPIPREIVSASEEEYRLLSNVYARVSPSVVNIDVSLALTEEEAATIDIGSGSGFIYDRSGHIVTNSHVVRNTDAIRVTFRDGYVAEADVIGIDDFSDLAVIQVDVDIERLLPVALGGSDDLYVGQRVIAIGNPFGLESSMTTGTISALGRTLPSAQLLDPTQQPFNNPAIIQIDAEINPGNSGGPLLDSYGELIGVNTAIRTETGQFQGVGFAVPVSTVRRVVPELIEKGRVDYSWLGISSLSPEGGFSLAGLAEQLDLPVTSGVLLQEVEQDSPADQAGLLGGINNGTLVRGRSIYVGGDIIVAIDGEFVDTMDDLVNYLVVNTKPGDEVTMTVIRGDETLEIPVALGSRP